MSESYQAIGRYVGDRPVTKTVHVVDDSKKDVRLNTQVRGAHVLRCRPMAQPSSPPKAHIAIHRRGVGGRVRDAVDLTALIVVKNEVAAAVAELRASTVERDDHRSAG